MKLRARLNGNGMDTTQSIAPRGGNERQMKTKSRLGRSAYLVYGIVCYVAFAATIVYGVGFVGNFWHTLGWRGSAFHSMDVGRIASTGEALVIDVLLLALFAAQHSVMARAGFKRIWTRVVPPAVERSTFVLAASLCLALLYWQWRPIGGVVWDVSDGIGGKALLGVSLAGWLVAAASTFMIDHAELFGLAQVVAAYRGKPRAETAFSTPGLYKAVRHPLYFGFIVAFWATAVMTIGHLVFAALTTVYILVAIRLEERDLVAHYGDVYRAYRRRVPMLLPLPRRGHNSRAGSPQSKSSSS